MKASLTAARELSSMVLYVSLVTVAYWNATVLIARTFPCFFQIVLFAVPHSDRSPLSQLNRIVSDRAISHAPSNKMANASSSSSTQLPQLPSIVLYEIATWLVNDLDDEHHHR